MIGEPRITPTNDNSALLAAMREAWGSGYQAAVTALREIGDATDNAAMAATIRTLADALQAMKP